MSDMPALEPPAEAGNNAAAFTVTELSAALKRTVEDSFGYVRVRGEISQPKVATSGHCYLRLKDENACIDGIIWRGTMSRISLRPEEGMEVIATGRLTTYPGRSSYQIIIDAVELAGQGALLKLLEDRKKKLAAEGLFDETRKKPLPYLPNVIGVVTSPTGAVIRDILHRLADRFPRHVLVWPVKVQGEGAAAEVAAAIQGFNALTPGGTVPRPDVIIVARGGGSLEDLWAFNEEIVVRAAAASAVPLIAAVGHETDWTLIDLAADRRAPTPTAAAEMAVPVRLDLLALVNKGHDRLMQAVARTLEERRVHLEGLVRGIPRLDMIVAQKTQDLDNLDHRLAEAPKRLLAAKMESLAMFTARLNPSRYLADMSRQRTDVTNLADRALRAATRAAQDAATRLENLWARLESVSPTRVLERGYAMVWDASGAPVTSVMGAPAGAGLRLEFADGSAGVLVSGAAPKPPRPAPKKDPGSQGTLL
jgi:exodeoxyribonuclease VII large subunit